MTTNAEDPSSDKTGSPSVSELDARVDREKAAYDAGIDRQGYTSLFAHCAVLWDKERDRVFREELVDKKPKRVLEFGCRGWPLVFLAETDLPEYLLCINISERELKGGRGIARRTGYGPEFQQMDAHQLDLPDNSFDVVFGFHILHHLDYELAVAEIYRVLRPGGTLVFDEPLDMNPIGRIVRRLTPKARTEDEAPLRRSHLKIFERYFDLDLRPREAFSVPAGLLSRFIFKQPDNFLTRSAFALDKAVARIPGIGVMFRHATLIARKPEAGQ